MTRRTDGSLSFGIKEWIAIGALLVSVGVAWGTMHASHLAAKRETQIQIDHLKDDLTEIKADVKELRRVRNP